MPCYKAITTRYCGPTDSRGARIIASDSDGNQLTLPYPYELSGEACHRKAAEALKATMAWTGDLVCGALKTGYVFVFTNRCLDGGGPGCCAMHDAAPAMAEALRGLLDTLARPADMYDVDGGPTAELNERVNQARAALRAVLNVWDSVA